MVRMDYWYTSSQGELSIVFRCSYLVLGFLSFGLYIKVSTLRQRPDPNARLRG